MEKKENLAQRLNPAKHMFYHDSARPCFRACPSWPKCPDRPELGDPCPVELRELEEFTQELLSIARNPRDPVAAEMAKILAQQKVRLQRGYEFFAVRPERQKLRSKRLHQDLLALEAQFVKGLAEFRKKFGRE